MDISIDSWLQLFCGLAAVIVAIMAIIHGNKNSRKAIEQQNRILEYQHKERKLDEYRKCLTDNMDLLNTVEAFSPMVTMCHTDYSRTRHEIVSRKAKIYACDLRYRYLFEAADSTPLLLEYRKHWNLGTAQLTVILDTMLECVNYLSGFSYNMETLKGIPQQISIYEGMIQVDSANATSYLMEIAKLRQEQSRLTDSLSNHKSNIDVYLTSIEDKINDLKGIATHLHNLTIKLIAEKEMQVKVLLNS